MWSLWTKGNLKKALEFEKKSLHLKEEIGDKSGIAFSFNTIGLLNNYQGNLEKALEYHKLDNFYWNSGIFFLYN